MFLTSKKVSFKIHEYQCKLLSVYTVWLGYVRQFCTFKLIIQLIPSDYASP